MVDFLDPKREYISSVLSRDHCVRVNDVYVKDLTTLKSKLLKDIIIVDNSEMSFSYQPENGICITEFKGSKDDTELLKISAFLTSISSVSDVRHHLSQYCHFKECQQ